MSGAFAEGWNDVRLGDLVKIKHGWPFKSDFFSEELTGQPIVAGIGNFQYTGGFRFDSTTLKEYRGNYPPEYELRPGDVLLVMTCQTAGGEILGVPGRIPGNGRRYLHNQRMGKVEIQASFHVDSDFLYSLFLWREFNRHLVATASGTKILHTAPNRIEAAQMIQELIELATDMREAHGRGEKLGFTEEELAFYDALEVNDSAVKLLGDETLKAIARELVDTVRRNTSIDWTVKESVRAKLRTLVERGLTEARLSAG
jgi:hypothetical protein